MGEAAAAVTERGHSAAPFCAEHNYPPIVVYQFRSNLANQTLMRLVHLNLIVGLASLQAFAVQMQGATCSVQSRSDCYPNKTYRGNLTVDLCLAHGCCFDTSSPSGEDWCFYPSIQAPVQT